MHWWTVCLLSISVVGCGEEPALPDISAGVAVSWKFAPASLAELGFTISVLVTQRPPQGATRCRQLPASARFTIDGEQVTDPGHTPEGCLDVQYTKGPVLDWENAPVTVRYEEDGQLIGEGMFRDLAPGTAATLTVPASGEARAGDEIVILPPSTLPTSIAGYDAFFPLDEPSSVPWSPYGVTEGNRAPTRSADGIHATVPRMVGRAAVMMAGMPYVPQADVVCTGFAACVAITDNTLGPVLLTVLP